MSTRLRAAADSAMLDAGSILVGHARPSSDVQVPLASPEHLQPRHPLCPVVVDHFLEQAQVVNSACRFRNLSSGFTASAASFPHKVEYANRCRGLCNEDTPKRILTDQSIFLTELAKHCKPEHVREDVLFVCEASSSNELASAALSPVVFVLLASAASRYGRHPAKQDFVRYKVRTCGTDNSYEGTVLFPVYQNVHAQDKCAIPSQVKRFLDATTMGCLKALSEEDVVREVMSFFFQIGQALSVCDS